jgi:predicted nucleic acid-binding Zn ribbon protein
MKKPISHLKSDPKSLEELIAASLKHGSLFFWRQRQRIFELWPRVVGEAAAAHSRPYAFNDGVLYVKMATSVCLQNYSYSLKEWLERYRIELGGPVVERIVTRLGAVLDDKKTS